MLKIVISRSVHDTASCVKARCGEVNNGSRCLVVEQRSLCRGWPHTTLLTSCVLATMVLYTLVTLGHSEKHLESSLLTFVLSLIKVMFVGCELGIIASPATKPLNG